MYPSERETGGGNRGGGAYGVGRGSGEAGGVRDGGGGGVVEVDRPAARQALALIHRRCSGINDLPCRRPAAAGFGFGVGARLGSGRGAPATAPPELQVATAQLVGRWVFRIGPYVIAY